MATLDKPRAPYTFVPLNKKIVVPSGADALGDAAHDRPFRDGICGRMVVRLTAESSLFVGGPSDKAKKKKDELRTFVQLPNGDWAIPGSTLRGMLRNVVEILSLSRLRTNDHRYAVRDLTSGARDIYGRFMADIVNKTPTPLVSAGWLDVDLDKAEADGAPDEVVGQLHPCSFAKVHYKEIEALAAHQGNRDFNPRRRGTSGPDKYTQWKGPRRVSLHGVQWRLQHGQRVGRDRIVRHGRYADEVRPLLPGTDGVLVFTGQPSDYDPRNPRGRRAKQRDFVFQVGERHRPLLVTRQVWRDFTFVHASDPQQKRLEEKANEELGYWIKRQEKGEMDEPGIPVFFLPPEQSDGLLRMGMAMMFRLPGRFSTLEAVTHHQAEAEGEQKKADVTEALFGHVPQRHGDTRGPGHAIKGRVSVGMCQISRAVATELGEVKAVLGLPKASYWPFYVEQSSSGPGIRPVRRGKSIQWTTWTAVESGEDAPRPRGWKRVRRRKGEQMNPPLPTNRQGQVLTNVVTRFKPLLVKRPVRFAIRIHNLRPFELGALLWAIELGGFEQARHQIGLAKGLGFGTVRLEIESSEGLFTVTGEPVDLEQARDAFFEFMETHAPGWHASHTLRALISAASPQAEPDTDLRHMAIDHPAFKNEFAQVKEQGWVLPSPTNPPGWDAWCTRMAERAKRIHDAAEATRREAEAREAEAARQRAESERRRQEEALASEARALAVRPVSERLDALRGTVNDAILALALWEWYRSAPVSNSDVAAHLVHLRPEEKQEVEAWLVDSSLLTSWNLGDQRAAAKTIRKRVRKRRKAERDESSASPPRK